MSLPPKSTITARRSIRDNNFSVSPSYKSQTKFDSSQESEEESSSNEIEEENNFTNTSSNQDPVLSKSSPILKNKKNSILYKEKKIIQEKPINVKTHNNSRSIPNRNVQETEYSSLINYQFGIITAIVIFIVGYYLNGLFASSLPVEETCGVEKLSKIYKFIDNKVWRHLSIGIENTLNGNPATPTVYLFLHQNTTSSQSLIKEIAHSTSLCFDPTLKPFLLDKNDFISKNTLNDYGHVIAKYKEEIHQGGVLLVANLNEIPGNAARALHAICDIYSPIVERVIIFLSLVPIEDGSNDLQIAEKSLYKLWREIDRFELDPLITRVTDQVLRLN